MKKVKIAIDDYTEMKNKLKFLEFYWSELNNKSNFARSYKYAPDVQSFIDLELYDQVSSIKVHALTKRVSITAKNYELLKKFAYISDDLKKHI
ncbi:hypothetical protein [uncultured Vagococcus sp.]|uniref:hypothetical protein n=1 Tax=uncultured Vagococcus sp. TaxID=189676 RepID=UPI0028D5B60A|nr:hypothetical protein [uncultured Vagococcus sp.]